MICRKQVDTALVRGIWFRYFHKKFRHVPILLQREPAYEYRDTKVPSYSFTQENYPSNRISFRTSNES